MVFLLICTLIGYLCGSALIGLGAGLLTLCYWRRSVMLVRFPYVMVVTIPRLAVGDGRLGGLVAGAGDEAAQIDGLAYLIGELYPKAVGAIGGRLTGRPTGRRLSLCVT